MRAQGDDLPVTFDPRSRVVRHGAQTQIEITSARPVNDPAVGLVVSVGCASPVSREFVLMLDPPVAPVAAVADETPRRIVEPTVPRALDRSPPRRAHGSSAVSGAGGARAARIAGAGAAGPRPSSPPDAASAARRPARARSSAAPVAASSAATAGVGGASLAPSSAKTARTADRRDRLSVVPTEAPATQGAAAAIPPDASMVASAPATSGASTGAAAPRGSGTAADPRQADDAGTRDRSGLPAVGLSAPQAANQSAEQSAQQASLQAQIKALTDQMSALRVQTAALTARNQTLQDAAFPTYLVWLLIALAAIAILVAGWMAWRYTQLRRSLEGQPWWTGSTVQAPAAGAAAAGPSVSGELAPLDAGTRMMPRPASRSDVRTSAVASVPAVPSHVERPRAPVRSAHYPPPIETDFTVSDIEAAMATVRTVSPPRKPGPNLEDSDFAPLGGPTMPSPFTEAPPAARPRQSPGAVQGAHGPGANFVDLDIAPMPAGRAASGAPAATVPPAVGGSHPGFGTSSNGFSRDAKRTMPLDLKLDIDDPFDPLASHSHLTTEIQSELADTEFPGAPASLDFELPSLTAHDAAIGPQGGADEKAMRARHGSTALDDVFATDVGESGPDTILDLDERDGSPLSASEIDSLTAIDGAQPVAPGTQTRLVAFADLLNQVDEEASADPLRAIAHLRRYVLRDEHIPTLLWLRLFDLYKEVDKKPVYEALAEALRATLPATDGRVGRILRRSRAAGAAVGHRAPGSGDRGGLGYRGRFGPPRVAALQPGPARRGRVQRGAAARPARRGPHLPASARSRRRGLAIRLIASAAG